MSPGESGCQAKCPLQGFQRRIGEALRIQACAKQGQQIDAVGKARQAFAAYRSRGIGIAGAQVRERTLEVSGYRRSVLSGFRHHIQIAVCIIFGPVLIMTFQTSLWKSAYCSAKTSNFL